LDGDITCVNEANVLSVWDRAKKSRKSSNLNFNCIAISPGGGWIAAAHSGDIMLCDVKQAPSQPAPWNDADKISEVAISPDGISPDGRHVVVTGSLDRKIKLWDISDGTLLTLLNASAPVSTVAFSPNGRWIASGPCPGSGYAVDYKVWLWEVTRSDNQNIWNIRKKHGLSHDFVNTVAFSPDNKLVLSGDDDGNIKAWGAKWGAKWDARYQEPEFTLKCPTKVSVSAVAYDGQYILAGTKAGTVLVWDKLTRNLVRNLSGHLNAVAVIEVSTDGLFIKATDSKFKTIYWSTNSWKQVVVTSRPKTVAFLGNTYIGGSGKTLVGIGFPE
ncbi:hypothetical protein HK405_014683, partial [Cladochytrium tenue]